MEHLILPIMILSTFISCNAQPNKNNFSYENFENEVLNYQPKKNEVPDKDFEHGVFVLNEVKKGVNNDIKEFNRADYFNILSSFLSIKESKDNIVIAYEKFRSSEGSCEYFSTSGLFKSDKFDLIRDDIEKQILLCRTSTVEESTEIDEDQWMILDSTFIGTQFIDSSSSVGQAYEYRISHCDKSDRTTHEHTSYLIII